MGLLYLLPYVIVDRDSSVGIATRYRLNGSGIESRWGARHSLPVQICPEAQPVSCTMGTGSFPGRGFNRPLSFSAEGKECVGLPL